MQNIKTVVDELAILGKKLDQEDITDAAMHRLDQSTYNPILDAIHARDSPIPFNELHENLINHELALAQLAPSANTHKPATVFYANHQSNRKSWPPRQENIAAGPVSPSKQAPQQTGQRPFLGKCQWCHQRGHSLSNCLTFKHFFPNISMPTPNRSLLVTNA